MPPFPTKKNVNILLSDFISNSSKKGYYNTSIGDTPDKVFGYYMCRGDIKPGACHSCIVDAIEIGQGCKYQEFIYLSSKCVFRYTNHSMYGVWEEIISGSSPLGVNGLNYEQYNRTLSSTLDAVIYQAAYGSGNNGSVLGFATKETNLTGGEKIYSMAQCTPDIVGLHCSSCLSEALSRVPSSYFEYQGVEAVTSNCLLNFYYKSLYDPGVAKPSKGDGLRPPNIVTFYCVLFLLMYFAYVGLD